jgi:toxin ParE1/3/4
MSDTASRAIANVIAKIAAPIIEKIGSQTVQAGRDWYTQIVLWSGEYERRYIGRPGRVSGTRELAISGTPYLAVYRVQNNRVEILRILHGRNSIGLKQFY